MTDDTTTARRALLELIVRAVEDDDDLTLAERGLLRPLVEAEMAHGRAMIDQFTANAPWLKAAAEELDAARTANAEAVRVIDMQRDLIGAQRRIVINAMGHREDQNIREDRCDHCGKDHLVELDEAIQTADRLYGEAFPAASERASRPGRIPDSIPTAPVRDPEPMLCSPLINPACPGHVGTDRCERAASHAEPAITCTALYVGEPGQTWHCTLNSGHNGDHVSAEDGNNYWNDHVGTYPAPDHQPQHALHEEPTT